SADSDGNITFNYNVSDMSSVSNCSLILNGTVNQTNLSITKDVVQNFTVNNLVAGAYNWYVNCTDAVNNLNKSVTRKVSVVKIVEFSGATTNLDNVENISAVPNLTIEKPEYGKLNFTDVVDLSNGSDIDTFVNVSFNRIEINSSALPALDKPARLALYNLTFSDPMVLKDGVECSTCTEVGYTGGIFEFDVTGFSVYSASETPVTATTSTTSSGGSSGGGSAKVAPKETFKVDENSFNVNTIIDEIKTREFRATSLVSEPTNIKVSLENLYGLVLIDGEINLEAKEKKDIEFRIIPPSEPGVYAGKIILTAGNLQKVIFVSINVQSKDTLFDISVNLKDSKLQFNETLKAQLNLVPIGEKGVDVTIKYTIRDFDGKTYYEHSETFYVNGKMSFVKEFETGKLGAGDYLVAAEMIYIGGIATASQQFEIGEYTIGNVKLDSNSIIFVVITVLILGVIVVYVVRSMSMSGRVNKLVKRGIRSNRTR
ncbi:MAG: hypothetical protein ABIA78_02800, partial [archaeon]